jgi:hypothetical protein
MFAVSLLGFTVSTIWAVILLFIWIAIAFWPARVAARKGYSFLLFFILSLFCFFLSLLVAYLMPNKAVSAPPAPSAPHED